MESIATILRKSIFVGEGMKAQSCATISQRHSFPDIDFSPWESLAGTLG